MTVSLALEVYQDGVSKSPLARRFTLSADEEEVCGG